ncbi:ABC transporter ATP-binding protein [Fontisphaera persica]|uniref:ABC transporter ATP-binding protein n=1 Tax=Fontisphaera persica TaxID=2974023 RepID=UPI0024C03E6E|nr:ABC transporter ATP-binding protein [Fontisphaera persica]WCJ60231.1 ABC transporter ATP-binding protein [Fontisphaera persica]
MLKLESVSKAYPGPDGAPAVVILREVSLELPAGASLAVIGPSGCGKSTLLNLMGTLDQPDSGKVWLEGRDLSQLDPLALAEVRNRRIGFVFQAHHLLPHCTVWENVLVPVLAQGGVSAEAEQRARRLLQRVGLGERLSHLPGQLSGGERQRVAVVRALINQPALLLADEPTGALDRRSAAELAQLLVELNREEQVTLVVVTHALELARQMGRVMELRDGQLSEVKP